MSVIRSLIPRLPALTRASVRPLSTTPIRFTQAGYGDPPEEKIENETPLPKGKDNGPNARAGHETSGQSPADTEGSGSADTSPSTGSDSKGPVGNAGGEAGASGGSGGVSEKEVKETKKIGEDPKKEEVGGAGVIGG